MKREIKFRALYEQERDLGNFLRWEYLGVNECLDPMLESCLNIKSEWMQSTNMMDVLGTEIFVGDILSKKWLAEVYKNQKTGAFMVRFGTNPHLNKPKQLYQYLRQRERAKTERECNLIIGNIHENPELL